MLFEFVSFLCVFFLRRVFVCGYVYLIGMCVSCVLCAFVCVCVCLYVSFMLTCVSCVLVAFVVLCACLY